MGSKNFGVLCLSHYDCRNAETELEEIPHSVVKPHHKKDSHVVSQGKREITKNHLAIFV